MPLGRRFDHLGIALVQFNAQQPIVMRRLIARRNAQPFVIRIEVCHGVCREVLPRIAAGLVFNGPSTAYSA